MPKRGDTNIKEGGWGDGGWGGGDGGGGWYSSVHYALWQAQLQDLIKIALSQEAMA